MSGKWDGGQLRVVTVAVNVSKEKCGDPLGMGSLSGHCAWSRGLILAPWHEARAALCPPAPGHRQAVDAEPAPSYTPSPVPLGHQVPQASRLGWGPPSVASKPKPAARHPVSVTAPASSPRVVGFWKSTNPLEGADWAWDGALRKTLRAHQNRCLQSSPHSRESPPAAG